MRSPSALEALRALPDAGLEALSGAKLMVRSLASLGALRAAVDAVALRWIAGLEQAGASDPASDPVRAAGHSDVGSLLAELWRVSLPSARQLCGVARATAPRYNLQGERLPAEFPEVAAVLLGGSADDSENVAPSQVSVEQAAAIIRELAKTGQGCSLEQRSMGERALVEVAPGLTVEQMRRVAIQMRDRLDQDGTEPREQILIDPPPGRQGCISRGAAILTRRRVMQRCRCPSRGVSPNSSRTARSRCSDTGPAAPGKRPTRR